MRKIFLVYLFFIQFIYINFVNSSENNIYKKIDIFGEVLEKINKEYVDEINQFSCKYQLLKSWLY